MSESNKGKTVISKSTEYNPVTHVTSYTVTYSDGSSESGTYGRSLSGAASATSASSSPKMKRQNTESEENTENKS